MGSEAGSRDSALYTTPASLLCHPLLWFHSEVSSPLGHEITPISNWDHVSACPGPLALREKPLLQVWGIYSADTTGHLRPCALLGPLTISRDGCLPLTDEVTLEQRIRSVSPEVAQAQVAISARGDNHQHVSLEIMSCMVCELHLNHTAVKKKKNPEKNKAKLDLCLKRMWKRILVGGLVFTLAEIQQASFNSNSDISGRQF